MISFIPNIVFVLIFLFAIFWFSKNVKKIYRNINLGISIDRNDNKKLRTIQMLKIAFGQSKMIDKPIVGLLHIVVYVGFLVINIELLEIIVDGALGTHRVVAPLLGSFYNFLIGFFEIFALLVIISVIVFWIRRNVINIKRFLSSEMKGWPKNDGNIILYVELILMFLFLTMNGADLWIQNNAPEFNYINAGSFPVSQYLLPIFDTFSSNTVFFIERTAWWLHIIGILCFLNYLYYSKHLHIILAFPNTYFSNLNAKGKFSNLKSIPSYLSLQNIDTDMIIPKQFLKTIKRTGLGKSLFYEMRYDENEKIIEDFILNKEPYNKSKILLAGKNFGCGSSREHAPWALSDFGIKCIISSSFADIFYNNCFKNGILPIKTNEQIVIELSEYSKRKEEVEVDLQKQEIKFGNKVVKFEVDSFKKKCLIEGFPVFECCLPKE